MPVQRTLGVLDAILLIVGIVIGAGVFVAPNLVARQLPSGPWILAAWLLAGVISLFGALAAAELCGMMPGNGGLYLYLKEAYGPLWGFLSGWMIFLILSTGAIAWLAVSFSIYLRAFVVLSEVQGRALSIAIIALFGLVNVRGLRLAANFQNALTVLKVLGVLVLIGAAFFAPSRGVPAADPAAPAGLSAFGLALIGCLLTYDGWFNVGLVAGDVDNPSRNVPRALFLGLSAIVILYVTINFAYLRVMSPMEIGASERVGAEAAQRSMGGSGATFVITVTLLSIAGAINGLLLAGARLYQRMARDGLFFLMLAADHPRFGTPSAALWASAGWSMLLVVTGTYETLGSFAMFAAYLFYGLMVAAVIVLRRRHPRRPRPYRMWGYPVTPVLFGAVALAFVGNTLRETPGPSFAALAIIGLGVPAYWFWSRRGPVTEATR